MDDIEDPLVLCKAITSIREYFSDKAVTKQHILHVLIKRVKLKKPTPGRSREYIAEPPSPIQAARMFDVMVSRGYLVVAYIWNEKLNNTRRGYAQIGEKFYRIGELRLAQCMETTWYKNRERKQKFVKKETSLDTRSCRALQQLYVMFPTTPFSYKVATKAASQIAQLADDKTSDFNDAEKIALKFMKRSLYSHDEGSFRDVWQKLIRNGYIVQHKIKTKDGYIKNTGLYRINSAYLKHCLAEMI
jgi:hypothetical protein